MAKITSVLVDRDRCLCHELCIYVCPDVFEFDAGNSIARVKCDADQYFISHDAQIREAEKGCPVYAIRLTELP
jgi:ferredoxin